MTNEPVFRAYRLFITYAVIVLASLVIATVSTSGEKTHAIAERNLCEIEMVDGSVLVVSARIFSPEERESSVVTAYRYPEDGSAKWVTDFTSLEYSPKNTGYYALVRVTERDLFIFCTWNGHYCIIDKQTGQLRKSGTGDEILREFDQFAPLKVTLVCGRSTGYAVELDGSQEER